MEISLIHLLLIATGCAVASAVIVMASCLLCCCYRRRRSERKIGRQERILYDIGTPCIVKIDKCQPSGTKKDFDNEERGVVKENRNTICENEESLYMFDEREVAEKAKNEDKTLLWTNRGQVVQGRSGADHAVESFISTDKQPDQITELYIKQSPCYICSTRLIQHFTRCHKKPVIYLASIRHQHNASEREGLRQLIQEGFDIKLWTHLHHEMHNDDHTTGEYIRELKNETTMYCYFGIYN